MKLTYLCECCDAVIDQLDIPDAFSGGLSAGLTGADARHIIKTGSGGGITVAGLCEDCRETLYGGPRSFFFSGPALH
ncbi:MAG TPA: DUF2757 family protein [Bacillota bacterium]|nr:DUF2757 family protein [Bacillota bacterium]